MKIKEIDLMQAGPVLVPIVDGEHYARVGIELGLELQPYNKYDAQFRKYLNILCEDLVVRLKLEKGGVIYIKFKRGFSFDFASVPEWLRGRFPSNDKNMVIPALIHDALFDYKTFSFSQSNKFYYQLMRLYGNGWWRSKFYYWGVCTDIARKRFDAVVPSGFVIVDWKDK